MALSLQGDGKAIFMVFIGAIIAIVFLQSIGDSVFAQSNTGTATNLSFTGGAINVSVVLEGRELLVATSVINGTNITLISQGVILATEIVNGLQTVTATINDTAGDLTGSLMNATYTFNPDGFLSNSVDRSLVALIVLFGALGALIFVIVVFIQNGTLGEMMGRQLGSRRRNR